MYIRFSITFVGEEHPINVAVQVIGCFKGKNVKMYHLHPIDIYGEDEIYTLGSIEFVKGEALLSYTYGGGICSDSDQITNISFSESISDFML